MIAGSLLVAALAIVADLILAGVQNLLVSPGLRAVPAERRSRLRAVSDPLPETAHAA
jgi:osmoprotectant transport system permease protein